MTINKYGKLLTIILIVLVVAILIGGGLLVYNYIIKPNRDREAKLEAIEEFNRSIEETGEIEKKQKEEEPEEEPEDNKENKPSSQEDEILGNISGNSNNKKKNYYKNFVMLGYISIPKTNVNEPILDSVTPDSLNTAVAVLYPSNAKLNEPGNVVIIGHNYKNGTFFSNNKKLQVGDKLKIKDDSGRELTYTIYDKFQTTEQDTSFYTRNTNGAVEVTLSTCTDDAKARIIILARVQ